MEEPTPPLRVAIAGAGLSGMCLAAILSEARLDIIVDVFEKDSQERDQGTSLDIDGPGQDALRAAGVLHLHPEISRPNSNTFKVYNVDDEHNPIAVFWQPSWLSWLLPPQPEVNRQLLRDALLDKVKGDHSVSVRFHSRVGSIDQDKLLSDKGDVLGRYDLIVDASGMNSPLRSLIVKSKDPKSTSYTGVLLVHGIVESPEATGESSLVDRLQEGSLMVIGQGTRVFMLQRFAADPADKRTSLYYFVEAHDPAEGMRRIGVSSAGSTTQVVPSSELDIVKAWLKQDMQSLFPQPYHNMVDAMTQAFLRPIHQHQELSELTWVSRPNNVCPLVLMGDALHAVPPWTGAGGNIALRDAHELADWIVQTAKSRRLSKAKGYLDGEQLKVLQIQWLERAAKASERGDRMIALLRSHGHRPITAQDLAGGSFIGSMLVNLFTAIWKRSQPS